MDYNQDNDRQCLNCGHAVPHNRWEYDAMRNCCTWPTSSREKVGLLCGHKVYNAECHRAGSVRDDYLSCYTMTDFCNCSEDNRLVADLKARIAELEIAELEKARLFLLDLMEKSED